MPDIYISHDLCDLDIVEYLCDRLGANGFEVCTTHDIDRSRGPESPFERAIRQTWAMLVIVFHRQGWLEEVADQIAFARQLGKYVCVIWGQFDCEMLFRVESGDGSVRELSDGVALIEHLVGLLRHRKSTERSISRY
jgi:hypothetical protein